MISSGTAKHYYAHLMHTGILLTDLSRSFDCISHELLIAKLYAYGFSKISLSLISDYFCGRKQRTKVRDKYSSWRAIIYGVFQGSILGPLFFIIYLDYFFLFSEGLLMANYADDNSPYESSFNIEELILKSEEDANILVD